MAMSDHHAARAQDGSAVSVLDPAAAYNHDIFNIVALPCIVFLNIRHLLDCYHAPPDVDVPPLTMFSLTRETHAASWPTLWWAMLAYILVDTTWLLLYPRCVMLARAILIHHALLLLTWVLPIYCWSGWEYYMSAALVVELNTFFLIAKRRVGTGTGTGTGTGAGKFLYEKGKGDSKVPPAPSPSPAPAMLLLDSAALHTALVCADHTTWVLIRCLWLPLSAYNAGAVWAHLARQCSAAGSSSSSGSGYMPSYFCHVNSGLFVLLAGAALLWQNALWTRDKYRGLLLAAAGRRGEAPRKAEAEAEAEAEGLSRKKAI